MTEYEKNVISTDKTIQQQICDLDKNTLLLRREIYYLYKRLNYCMILGIMSFLIAMWAILK